MRNRIFLTAVLCVQVVCAAFFVVQIFASVFALPLPPLSWTFIELIEIGAAIGLVTGVGVSILALRQARAQAAKAEAALKRAQSAFRDVLEDLFTEWNLTPAERDVAIFAIKGFSTQEMADLRRVSEGTIKAQTAAIYRKAGVSGRPQLLSLFIDEMVDETSP
ncbi:MAG: helix-turn-helix transcriptional regulator [Boseongicola sp.]|nr:helix-turn-helix transcriptional regulator [Boseongicola sp.]